MKKNKTAGFVSVNNGIIRDCFSHLRFHTADGTSGFCQINNGGIAACFAKIKGKKYGHGFCQKDNHKLLECYWTAENPEDDEKNKILFLESDASPSNQMYGAFQKKSGWVLPEDKTIGDIDLAFQNTELDLGLGEKDLVLISNAKQLLELIEAVNSGDREAASAAYRLTQDISLGGKIIDPIGKSQEYPFSGIFDGNGFEVRNFRLKAEKEQSAGFFGYINDGATVANLALDCIVTSKNERAGAAAFCAVNKGKIINCRAIARLSLRCTGAGFTVQNDGEIYSSAFYGSTAYLIPFWLLPLGVVLAGMLFGLLIAPPIVRLLSPVPHYTDTFQPIEQDPGLSPIDDGEGNTSSKGGSAGQASFEFNQSMTVSSETMTGKLDIKNPSSGRMDFVVTVMISDAELQKRIGKVCRPLAEQQKLVDSGNYKPEETYTTLFQSGRIPTGYGLENITLGALDDGSYLPKGQYELTVVLDFYHPQTHEKALVNSQLPVELTIA